MIHRVLVRKYIGHSMLLFGACAVALFAFAWVRVWVVSLLNMGQFKTIVEQFREYEKFAPISFDAMFTYSGRVAMTYDEPIVILCVVIWCIARGSDVISGELGRGTLEMLLAQPIRRRTLLCSQSIVSITGLALLCLLVWAGIHVGIQTTSVQETQPPPSMSIPWFDFEVPISFAEPTIETVPLSEKVQTPTFASPTFHLFAFGFFLLGLTTMLSSFDRYRWRTIGLTVGIYILQLVMFGLGKATEKLEWLMSVSFFSCYKPQKMASLMSNEGAAAPWSLTQTLADASFPPLVYPLMLISMGVVCYLVADYQFSRRDLPAPT